MDKISIIETRPHYIAVYKPAGIPSQGVEGDKGGNDMVSALSLMLGKEVFPVHRLDRETEGVMVYATDKIGAAKLSALITAGAFHKTYLAVCEGVPEEDGGELRDLLFFDRRKNKSYVADRMRSGVKEAVLKYEVLGKTEIDVKICSLLRVRLYTGRTHQIRVQFASRKMPLAGDARYGSHIKMPLALCSHEIGFRDPFDGKDVCYKALPSGTDGAFSRFEIDI